MQTKIQAISTQQVVRSTPANDIGYLVVVTIPN